MALLFNDFNLLFFSLFPLVLPEAFNDSEFLETVYLLFIGKH